MGDTLITVVAIVLAATLMFVFPLMTMSNRADDVSQLSVQSLTTQFVDDVRTTGKITSDKYNKFVENIHSTGNTYDVEIEVKVRDENPGKKTTQANSKKIGEDVYYSIYTTQIENTLKNNNAYNLKEGDIVSVSVKNTNTTISQLLRNFFYRVTGNDSSTIGASNGGIVTVNGRN